MDDHLNGDATLLTSEDDAAGADAPFDPSTIRDPLPQPLFSFRRLVILALLGVAAGLLVLAWRSADESAVGTPELAIRSYEPSPGGRVPRQSEVGVVLEDGWDGRLSIDGVAIPEEQMVGAIDPGSEEFQALPEEQRSMGARPNNRNVVKFQPGPGKVITEHTTGTIEVEVTYWRIADGRETATSTTFTVRVF